LGKRLRRAAEPFGEIGAFGAAVEVGRDDLSLGFAEFAVEKGHNLFRGNGMDGGVHRRSLE
jgi:hypothetical protein